MAELKGLGEVMRNLNRQIKDVNSRSKKGLKKAAIFIQGESQEVVPHEFGVLINTAFNSADDGIGSGPRARVGYTAEYAPFVHEMPSTNNFTKTGTGPKFLQKPVAENHKTILDIIRKEAKFR
jgi:hypothetical protein